MGRGKRQPSNKPLQSYMRECAGRDAKGIMKQSKIYFFQTYSTYVKQKGSVISLSEEDFKQFYSNVNGYYRNQMKSLRADYEKDVVIKNVKEERQWLTMMNTLCNGYHKGEHRKITAVLYDMSQNS